MCYSRASLTRNKGSRNENTTIDVQSYEAGQDKKLKNKGDKESGGKSQIKYRKGEEHYVGTSAMEMKVQNWEKEEWKT